MVGASSETGVVTKVGLGGHEVREGNVVGGGRVRQGPCRFPCKDKTKHDLIVSTLLEALVVSLGLGRRTCRVGLVRAVLGHIEVCRAKRAEGEVLVSPVRGFCSNDK